MICPGGNRSEHTELKGISPCSRQGLPHTVVTDSTYELLPRAFHPFPAKYMQGGLVSVALSLGLLPVAVSNYHFPMLPGLSSPHLKPPGEALRLIANSCMMNSNAGRLTDSLAPF